MRPVQPFAKLGVAGVGDAAVIVRVHLYVIRYASEQHWVKHLRANAVDRVVERSQQPEEAHGDMQCPRRRNRLLVIHV